MQDAKFVSKRSLDQLEGQIASLASHINASEYEFLVLVREFDLRQGWKAWNCTNCADWLNWCCGIAPATARGQFPDKTRPKWRMALQTEPANVKLL